MISLMKVSTPLDVMNKILHPESGTETKEMYSSFVATQRRVKNEIIAKETFLLWITRLNLLHCSLRYVC